MAKEVAYNRVFKKEIPAIELKKVTIRLEDDKLAKLKAHCKEHKLSLQQFLESCIDNLPER